MATSPASRLQHAGTPGAAILELDVYLTDGRRLFRIVTPYTPATEEPAELEDCFTLETRPYGLRELWAMRLRRVLPDPAQA